MADTRLDIYLVNQHFYETRSRAQDAISEGKVSVNNKIIYKCSYRMHEDDTVKVLDSQEEYASRGAYKLLDAIDSFDIVLKDKVCLDLGASTGGFSDVCLKKGVTYVYAVDVGHGQLIERLANDERVCNIEGVNCRDIDLSLFDKHIDFVCMDVSFISINKIVANLVNQLIPPYEMVFLIKPQFEVGKAFINKHGIVRNEKAVISVIKDYLNYFKVLGLEVLNLKKCNISGRDGNQEYLVYLSNSKRKSRQFNVEAIVKQKG